MAPLQTQPSPIRHQNIAPPHRAVEETEFDVIGLIAQRARNLTNEALPVRQSIQDALGPLAQTQQNRRPQFILTLVGAIAVHRAIDPAQIGERLVALAPPPERVARAQRP